MRRWRLGRRPCFRRGSMISQSAASRPIRRSLCRPAAGTGAGPVAVSDRRHSSPSTASPSLAQARGQRGAERVAVRPRAEKRAGVRSPAGPCRGAGGDSLQRGGEGRGKAGMRGPGREAGFRSGVDPVAEPDREADGRAAGRGRLDPLDRNLPGLGNARKRGEGNAETPAWRQPPSPGRAELAGRDPDNAGAQERRRGRDQDENDPGSSHGAILTWKKRGGPDGPPRAKPMLPG